MDDENDGHSFMGIIIPALLLGIGCTLLTGLFFALTHWTPRYPL